jgi:photosystem II stability/assembly factor-like uncharacterized protein
MARPATPLDIQQLQQRRERQAALLLASDIHHRVCPSGIAGSVMGSTGGGTAVSHPAKQELLSAHGANDSAGLIATVACSRCCTQAPASAELFPMMFGI